MTDFEFPGVYIEEIGAGGHAIAGVPTSTAAFIGLTGIAFDVETNGSLTGKPILVTSLADYERSFGGSSGAGYDLHQALRLFFDNGGERAIIVSVGPFGPADPAALRAGLDALDEETESAILLAPDALRLPKDEYHAFVREMIARAAKSRRRMAIVDLHQGDAAAGADRRALLADFRAAMAALPQEARSFGAAYHPWLVTDAGPAPPSAAVAGIYARTDKAGGVWKAPANAGVIGVSDVTDSIEEADLGEMNASSDGLAVGPIRVFPGRGILVWGARTLDANNGDARYVPTRRTLIYVEQSIAGALGPFAFEPNDPPAWTRARAMAENFLIDLWRQGALQGAKAQEAFFVRCDRTTMSQDDLDNGRLVMIVGLALLKPAEFIPIAIGQHAQPA
jgi:phage tail sheath protein FI